MVSLIDSDHPETPKSRMTPHGVLRCAHPPHALSLGVGIKRNRAFIRSDACLSKFMLTLGSLFTALPKYVKQRMAMVESLAVLLIGSLCLIIHLAMIFRMSFLVI